jgi:hypothetical protein
LAYGKKISPHERNSFETDANVALNSSDRYAEKDAELVSAEVVAAGRLFGDYSLRPGETATRTIIFHVRAMQYDQVSLIAQIPTTSRPGRLDATWTFNPKVQALQIVMYRIDGTHGRTEMAPDRDGHYTKPEDGLQSFTAHAELSL